MDKIGFGSFPRSGNHFFLELINQIPNANDFVYLEHRIDPIGKHNKCFTTIRSPLECVTGWIVLMNDIRLNRAEQVLEWYCAYYQKCKDMGVLIIPFTQLISEPMFCMNHVLKTFDLPLVDTVEFDLSTGFHQPTADKSSYGEVIDEMRLAPSFSRAMGLFEELCVPVG